jgi:hypothetical protein
MPIARAASVLALACAALAACSLTDLSGFSGGSGAGGPDGSAAPGAPPAAGDASLDAGADAVVGPGADADADAATVPFLAADPPELENAETIDLTAEGTLDWVQRSTLGEGNRCASCARLLGDIASAATLHDYDDDTRTFVWKNGTPAVTGADHGGVYVKGVGSGFLLSAAAAPERRVLTLYTDTFYTGAAFTASLQGASAPPVVVGCSPTVGAALFAVRFDFAGPKGATLFVAYAETEELPIQDASDGTSGNVAISAATLAPDP